MLPQVVLSAQLNDGLHGRPVVQGLRSLAQTTNDQSAQLAQLMRRVGAIHVPTMAEIAAALGATGTNPVNPPVTPGGGTLGGSVILYGTHGDRVALVTSTIAIGTEYIETDRFALYEYTATGWLFLGNIIGPMRGFVLSPDDRPGDLGFADVGFIYQGNDANGAWWQWSGSAWVFQIGTGVPIEVTLIPDTKPTLGVNDVGFPIWATDYHRFYLWSGSVWVEGEHNDARYQIGAFDAVPDQLGWFLCDGSTVKQSQQNATVIDYTTPNLTATFLRGDSTPGGTGGTVDHVHEVNIPVTPTAVPVPNTSDGPVPNTSDGPSATVLVDNDGGGSTVAVGDGTHTHDLAGHTHDLANHVHDIVVGPFDTELADNLPPYYNVLMYIRL